MPKAPNVPNKKGCFTRVYGTGKAERHANIERWREGIEGGTSAQVMIRNLK
jgi:hypothetical protein